MFLGSLVRSARKHENIPVNGICFDSRKVKRGNIFFAIQGNKTSGIKFISDAVKKGASVIIIDKKIKFNNTKIPLVLVRDCRESLSEACANFYKKKPTKYNSSHRN